MYYFNPEGYGQEYFVMAETREEAIMYVKRSIQNKIDQNKKDGYCYEVYEDIIKEIDDYRIDELPEGWVVQTEIC